MVRPPSSTCGGRPCFRLLVGMGGGGGGVTAGAPAPFPLACTESGGGNRLLLQGKVGGMWIVEGLPKPILLGGVVCT